MAKKKKGKRPMSVDSQHFAFQGFCRCSESSSTSQRSLPPLLRPQGPITPPKVIALLKAAVNFLPTPFALDTSGLPGRWRWRSAAVSVRAARLSRCCSASETQALASRPSGWNCPPAPDPKHDEGSETANTRMDAGNETTSTLVVGRCK